MTEGAAEVICALFGRKPEDLIDRAPNAAKPPTLGPQFFISHRDGEFPERIIIMTGLSAERAQTIARRLPASVPMRIGPLPGDAERGVLSDFQVQDADQSGSLRVADITAAITLNAAAKRELAAHEGPPSIALVLEPDRSGEPVNVLAAIWYPPQGAALNAAGAARAGLSDRTLETFRRLGWRSDTRAECRAVYVVTLLARCNTRSGAWAGCFDYQRRGPLPNEPTKAARSTNGGAATTGAPGALVFTHLIPASIPAVVAYISLVPITSPLPAFKTKNGSSRRDVRRS